MRLRQHRAGQQGHRRGRGSENPAVRRGRARCVGLTGAPLPKRPLSAAQNASLPVCLPRATLLSSGPSVFRSEVYVMTREYNVIDADGHILEPPDLWERYIEPKYRNHCPKLIIDGEGNESFFVDENFDFGLRRHGKEPATLGVLGSIGSRDGEVETRMPYLEGRKGGFDPHARIVDMEREGIDAAFLYPSLGLFLGAVKDPEAAAADCRAYNRW